MTTVKFGPAALLRLAVLPVLLALAGCNTIGGFGEDMQAGGRAVEGTAQDVEDDMND